MNARLVVCLLLSLLCACGEELPREAVEPLSATDSELSQLYKWGVGPWPVETVTSLQLQHPLRDDFLSFNVWYPARSSVDTAFPVLLFSHGNWSNNSSYDNLIQHWVSHGYIVIAPLHMDGNGGPVSGTLDMIRYGNFALIQARVEDLTALLDQLPVVESMVPGLAGRMDHARVAATGHSFGAFNAQQLGGAGAFDTDSQRHLPMLDERISAVLAVSPPGPMFDEINQGSWQQQSLPTLMTTGTWDTNAMFWPDWRAHRMSFDTAIPGDQYALVVQGADHYLGNLICRLELEEDPQHDALALINTAAVAFLDAYLKDDADARAFLDSGQLNRVTGQFARLENR
jgi:predicted dienelactone hydrolase